MGGLRELFFERVYFYGVLRGCVSEGMWFSSQGVLRGCVSCLERVY